MVAADNQGLDVPGAQLRKEGHRALGLLVALDRHGIDFTYLKTDGGSVAGFLAATGTRRFHQRRFTTLPPRHQQIGVGSEVGRVDEENAGALRPGFGLQTGDPFRKLA